MSYEIFRQNIGPRRLDIYDSQRYALPPDARENTYFNLFSAENFDFMSREITRRLAGVHPLGKNIIVGDDNIMRVLDSFYQGYKKDPEALKMMTIAYIVDYIKDEYQIEQQNNALNAWVMMYPEDSTIRQYAPIKLRERRPTNFEFHYTY